MAKETERNESNSKVMICRCEHPYQDLKYGKYLRLHNVAKSKSPGVSAWTCTVCGLRK